MKKNLFYTVLEGVEEFEWKATNLLRHHRENPMVPENLATHQWVTAMVALKLKPDLSREALIRALTHDLGEIFTGDVPSPIKRDHPKLKEILDKIENENNPYNELKISNEEYLIIKLADQIAFLLFAREEQRRGNSKYKKLEDTAFDQIEDINDYLYAERVLPSGVHR